MSKKLSFVLLPQNNNFDLIRLICAMLVIYGHANALTPPPASENYTDFVYLLIGCHSSSIAVYIFFFLSGLLVTNSLITSRDAVKFICARLFRIYPGFLVLLFITTFVLGPILTTTSLSSYFSIPNTYGYFIGNLFLITQHFLPGVFDTNAYKSVVNGSLWTIKYELIAYLVIVFLFSINLLNRKSFLLILGLVVTTFIVSAYFPQLKGSSPLYLMLVFCIGVSLALWKEHIDVDYKTTLILCLLWLMTKHTFLNEFFLFLMVFSGMLFFSANDYFRKMTLKYDVSYGVYLYGFLIAQMLAKYYPMLTIGWHQIITISLSLCVGLLSSIYIENPMIKMGKLVGAYLNRRGFKLQPVKLHDV